ncbi:MAG: single-stranded DNA-binding protein [Bacteroidales bacterium]|nr:single-stranded DNA-binding protein [Bacteroidales bacterium]
MNGVNKVILIGRLGKDPEVMTFENGTKKVSFSLATTETYKGKDGTKQSKTEWHNIVLWRGLADVAEKYLKKGDKIYLEGKIRSRQYDAKDGSKRYITEINGDNFLMMGSKKDSSNSYNHNPSAEAAPEEPDISSPVDDDLPF